MSSNKIIRTICYFTDDPSPKNIAKIQIVVMQLEAKGYLIQTKRICTTLPNTSSLHLIAKGSVDYTSVGTISYEDANATLPNFLATNNLAFNIDLAAVDIKMKHVDLLFNIIKENPSNTHMFKLTFKRLCC